jgi:outer membrane protein with glycine zipper
MKRILAVAAAVLFQGTVIAQDLYVYPAKDQNKQQTDKDKFECSSWAKGQTNFDPTSTPQATMTPQQKKSVKGGVGRGSLRGGALGLGVGTITGHAGRGAATGAVVGGTLGGVRSSAQNKGAQQAETQQRQQQVAQYQQGQDSYSRAYAACLQGRGYTVK